MKVSSLTQTPVKKILIIEDEGDMCLLLNIILNGKEMQLDHVKNLKAAVVYLQNTQPDAVLIDNKLPDGFGVDFIGFIKKTYPSIKIMMISGFDASVSDVAIENGADRFLPKPFTKEELYASVKTLFNN